MYCSSFDQNDGGIVNLAQEINNNKKNHKLLVITNYCSLHVYVFTLPILHNH